MAAAIVVVECHFIVLSPVLVVVLLALYFTGNTIRGAILVLSSFAHINSELMTVRVFVCACILRARV